MIRFIFSSTNSATGLVCHMMDLCEIICFDAIILLVFAKLKRNETKVVEYLI